MFRTRKGMCAPTFHASNFFAREAFAKNVFAHQILFCGLHIGLGLNVMAQIAQHLHRALIGDMRAWCVCQPTIAVHHHIIDAIAGQQCRAEEPAGPVPMIRTSVVISAIIFILRVLIFMN